MKITLHIGSTKTGSSALQTHLFEGRKKLAKRNILYPDTGVVANAHHLIAASIHPFAYGLHRDLLPESESARHEWFREKCAEILAEAETTQAEHVILSSEYWWGVLPKQTYNLLSETFDGHEVRVTCAIRRQDHWLESSYLQAVKSGEKRPFDEWLAWFDEQPVKGANYLWLLRRFRDQLNPKDMRVVPYEFENRTNFTRQMVDIVSDSDMGKAIVPRSAKVVNPSPDAKGLSDLLDINNAAANRANRDPNAIARVMRTQHRPVNSSENIVLLPGTRHQILRRASEPNRKIALEFAAGQPGSLFDLSDVE